MAYARIQDGIVVEMFTPPDGVNIEGCFHPDLKWVPVPADLAVDQRWKYDGVTFTPPDPVKGNPAQDTTKTEA